MDPKTKTTAVGRKKSKKERSPVAKFITTVISILLVFILAIACSAIGLVGGGIIGYIKSTPPIPDDKLKIQTLTSFVYDKDGKQISTIHGSENIDRMIAKYKEVPANLRNAFISIEDKRFYSHNGIDLQRIAGAALNLVMPGSSTYGGSTITQQVVKAITGDTRRTLQRKVQEQWRAIQLERKLEKWQILELYFNLIYMGENCYGVKSAAKTYFDKNLDELSLKECASLAGITNLPAYYDPFYKSGKAHNLERTNIILGEMLKSGYITQSQYDSAMKEKLHFVSHKKVLKKANSKQSYFVDQVIRDVIKDLQAKGLSYSAASTAVYNNGLKIYTTMDSKLQSAMNKVYLNKYYFPGAKNSAGELPQSSMVVIDPATSQVRAMYGGRGKKVIDSGLNRATQIQRQVGSAFKPIADYGPAINEHTITEATVVDDAPSYMNGVKYGLYPKNFTRNYQGLVTVKTAIARSINVVAAKVFAQLGADISFKYLKKSGIDMTGENKGISIALGGLTHGVNPMKMAAAYVPFDNKGIYTDPITYTKVLDSDGKVILDKTHDTDIKPVSNVVYTEGTSFVMTDMLRAVLNKNEGGTASYISLHNSSGASIPIAAKTGTTSDDKDRWFVGFTPKYVAAVWYGYDTPTEIRLSTTLNPSAIIWRDVLQNYYKSISRTEAFPAKPSDVIIKNVCKYSGELPTALCSHDLRGSAVRVGYFIKGTEPTAHCTVHVTAIVDKASKAAFGRYLLAGQYCPTGSIKQMVFIRRTVPYIPLQKGAPYPLDWGYELPTKYCTIHNSSSNYPTPTPTPGITPTGSPTPTDAPTPPTGDTTPTDPATN